MRGQRAPVGVLVPVALGVVVAVAASLGVRAAVLVAGAAGAILLSGLAPLYALAAILVVTCQLTGGRFTFAGFKFLPEHVAVVIFATALLMRATGWLLRRAAAFEMLLLAWIVWNLVVSIFYAPQPSESLAIVGWMGLAWLILWCTRSYFVAQPEQRARILDLGAKVAAGLGAIAFLIWAVALVWGTTVGVQPDFVTGEIAAKGLALEANFLGSQELFWLFIVIRRRMRHEAPASAWLVTGMILGIVASMTRAVWLAAVLLLVGSFVIARVTTLRNYQTSGESPRRSLGQALIAGLCMSALLVALGNPAVQKFRVSLDFGTTTGQSRVTAWRTALADLRTSRSYANGLGTNSFGQRHLSPTLPGEPDYLGNLPLSVLYDTGTVGVVLFSGAMLSLIVRGRSARARLLNALFVLILMIVGAATSPIWMGFVWVTMAAIDTDPDPPPETDPTDPEETAMTWRVGSR